MRDLAFVGFLGLLILMGLRRPFLFLLAYAYVDIVSPQHLSYYLLNSVPISLILAALSIGGWLIADDKSGARVAPRQWLMIALLAYAGFTTMTADMPVDALTKWDWAWKSLFWAIFLPLALRTRLRIEAYLLVMVLSASAIIIVGGLKTIASGGGYGVLNLMVEDNSGLYEGSTISTVAIAIVPIILWLAKFGTIFPPDKRVRLFAAALIFACLLMPIGTETRTGLVCIALLAVLMLRHTKRRLLYLFLAGLAGLIAVPFLPASFTNRMQTIQTYQSDSSASTRIAVWAWTWNYAQSHPLGGGFEAYRQNQVRVQTVPGAGAVAPQPAALEQARAYHSAYFEMLGEQGFPGLLLWLALHISGLVQMELIRRRYSGDEARPWAAPLATALQHAQLIYLVGALFVGIAWQPFILMLLGVQIGFAGYLKRLEQAGQQRPFRRMPAPDPV